MQGWFEEQKMAVGRLPFFVLSQLAHRATCKRNDSHLTAISMLLLCTLISLAFCDPHGTNVVRASCD